MGAHGVDPSDSRFEADPADPEQRHFEGVAWFQAPSPGRWHWCWAQSLVLRLGMWEHRCPCGAIRASDAHLWSGRNSRDGIV